MKAGRTYARYAILDAHGRILKHSIASQRLESPWVRIDPSGWDLVMRDQVGVRVDAATGRVSIPPRVRLSVSSGRIRANGVDVCKVAVLGAPEHTVDVAVRINGQVLALAPGRFYGLGPTDRPGSFVIELVDPRFRAQPFRRSVTATIEREQEGPPDA